MLKKPKNKLSAHRKSKFSYPHFTEMSLLYGQFIAMNEKVMCRAIRAAWEAGVEIMKVYAGSDADFETESKADGSPLTRADRAAHRTIVEYLGTEIPLLSEEGKSIPYSERKNWKEFWMVDPLDGTKEFIKRNGEFTVNIAYVRDGVPEGGVVYAPVRGLFYFGLYGRGAYRMSVPPEPQADEDFSRLVSRSEALPLAGSEARKQFVVVASRSHLSPSTAAYIESLRREHEALETVSIGSSLKLCLVAEGTADVYPRFAPTMEWDTAAGHAVVRAAGREVCQAATGEPLRYNKENLLNPDFIAR